MSEDIVQKLVIYFGPFLFALCFHEFSHGWVARRKGDRTAEIMGRLTMNPIAHVDPMGTLFLPIMSIITGFPSIGWAKPVPVDARNLKHPRQDMFWIALAGPMSNILLGTIGALGIAIADKLGFIQARSTIVLLAVVFIQINFLLALFNFIPVHPLDGGKIIGRFLPASWDIKMEQYQNYLVIGLFIVMMSGGLRFIAPVAELMCYGLIDWFGQLLSFVSPK